MTETHVEAKNQEGDSQSIVSQKSSTASTYIRSSTRVLKMDTLKNEVLKQVLPQHVMDGYEQNSPSGNSKQKVGNREPAHVKLFKRFLHDGEFVFAKCKITTTSANAPVRTLQQTVVIYPALHF